MTLERRHPSSVTAASQRRQRLCILGATGSVGSHTLDVVSRHPDQFEVFALAGHRRLDALRDLCLHWHPRFAVVADAKDAALLQAELREQGNRTEVCHGPQALCDMAAHPDADVVVAAIVGSAGLNPCLAAARAGKRLLLANKEALVVGGALFMREVQQGGAQLLPLDSEHSAIFQCLPADPAQWNRSIDHIVLTASGGPFRTRAVDTFSRITVAEACAHPNWSMGRKISVDSATMMNKALEVIEAHWLFGLPPERIRVVIHPQSVIHSMVVCPDGSVLAQLGTPDMRVPIAVGLFHPHRAPSGAQAPAWFQTPALTFEEVDPLRFPGLRLAWDCLHAPEGTCTVLNAANEEAVEGFLSGTIRFDQIHTVNLATLDAVDVRAEDASSLESLLALDAKARAQARACMKGLPL